MASEGQSELETGQMVPELRLAHSCPAALQG